MPPCLNPTLWRSSPYTFKGYLWIDKPPVVFQAQVADAFIIYPVADIGYTNVTVGSYSNLWAHQQVLFGTAPGLDDLGRGRLRTVPSGDTIYIGRSSQGTQDGTCNIVQGSWITVLDAFPLMARIPFIADGQTIVNGGVPALTTQFRDWNLPYTVAINGSPCINLGGGPGYAKTVDSLTNLITIRYRPGALSKGYDSNIVTWNWNVGDGTITSGPFADGEITVTFPVGRRHVHLTGTDGNGNTTTRHQLVVACKVGTAYAPIRVFDMATQKQDLNGSNNGVDIRVWESIPRSTYPDNMMVIMWEDETYKTTTGPLNVITDTIGQTGFEHIKFCGWHHTDTNISTAQPTGTLKDVTLHCLDVAGWLNQRPGFPIEVNRKAVPTSWLQMKSANLDKYWWYILYYFSTAPFITDIYDSNTGDMYAFSRLGSGQQSLYQQVQELSDRAIGYEFTTNEQGMLYNRANQNLLRSADRTSVNIIDLTDTDIADIHFVADRQPKTHWNRGAAVLATTDDIDQINVPPTAFAVSPGKGAGQGPTAIDHNEQLCNSADELFRRTANRDAEENPNYKDLELTLRYPGDAGIEPAYGQWIRLTLSAVYAAQRGITFTTTRLRVISSTTERTVSPTGNTKVVKVVGRVETVGIIAVDDTPPLSTITAAPPKGPPALIKSPRASAWGQRSNFTPTRLQMLSDGGHVARLYNVTSSMAYVDLSPTDYGSLGGGVWMVASPYEYKTLVTAWVNEIRSLSNFTSAGANPVWTSKYIANTAGGRNIYSKIEGSINWNGYWAWIERDYSVHTVYYCYTFDDFATVHYTNLGYNTDRYVTFALWPFSTNSNGVVYLQAQRYPFDTGGDGYKSIDWGETFSPYTNADYGHNGGGINVPYSLRGGGEARSTEYFWVDYGWTSHLEQEVTHYGPDQWTGNVSKPSDASGTWGSAGMNSLTIDGNCLNWSVRGGGFYVSDDAGHTWRLTNFNAVPVVNGWPTNQNLIIGGQNGNIYYSANRGQTVATILAPFSNVIQVFGDLSEVYNTTVHP